MTQKEVKHVFGIGPMKYTGLTTGMRNRRQRKEMEERVAQGISRIIRQFKHSGIRTVTHADLRAHKDRVDEELVCALTGEIVATEDEILFKPHFKFPRPRTGEDRDIMRTFLREHPHYSFSLKGNPDFRKTSFANALTAAFAFGVSLRQYERGNNESAEHAAHVSAHHTKLHELGA